MTTAAVGEQQPDRLLALADRAKSTAMEPMSMSVAPPTRAVVFAGSGAALSDLVHPGRDSRARSGACSVYQSDSGRPLAGRHELLAAEKVRGL